MKQYKYIFGIYVLFLYLPMIERPANTQIHIIFTLKINKPYVKHTIWNIDKNKITVFPSVEGHLIASSTPSLDL
jgi:hypothetical protein